MCEDVEGLTLAVAVARVKGGKWVLTESGKERLIWAPPEATVAQAQELIAGVGTTLSRSAVHPGGAQWTGRRSPGNETRPGQGRRPDAPLPRRPHRPPPVPPLLIRLRASERELHVLRSEAGVGAGRVSVFAEVGGCREPFESSPFRLLLERRLNRRKLTVALPTPGSPMPSHCCHFRVALV